MLSRPRSPQSSWPHGGACCASVVKLLNLAFAIRPVDWRWAQTCARQDGLRPGEGAEGPQAHSGHVSGGTEPWSLRLFILSSCMASCKGTHPVLGEAKPHACQQLHGNFMTHTTTLRSMCAGTPCSYNKEREDFDSKESFDDYLEEVEDISKWHG